MTIKELFKNVKANEELTINYYTFENYNYFLFEKGNRFYYVEQSENHYLYDLGNITITAYIKYDYNTKQQLTYPETIETIEDLYQFIASAEKRANKPLKETFKQKVNFDFIASKSPDEKVYKTIFDRMILGFRELDIIQNITSIEMVQHDEKYKVYKIWSNNKYFEIEYNSQRVVG